MITGKQLFEIDKQVSRDMWREELHGEYMEVWDEKAKRVSEYFAKLNEPRLNPQSS